jgi:hypothetical protein
VANDCQVSHHFSALFDHITAGVDGCQNPHKDGGAKKVGAAFA